MSVVYPRTRFSTNNNDDAPTVYRGGTYTNGTGFTCPYPITFSTIGTSYNMGGFLNPPIEIPLSVIEYDPPGYPGFRGIRWSEVYNTYVAPRIEDIKVAMALLNAATITNGWNTIASGPRYYYKETHDHVVPNFKARSSKGEIFINSYRVIEDELVASQFNNTENAGIEVDEVSFLPLGSYGTTLSVKYGYTASISGTLSWRTYGTWKSTQSNAVVTPAIRNYVFQQLDDIPHIGNVSNAINNAYAAIDEAILELPTTAAEFHKTLDTIVSAMIKLAKIVKAIKSGKFLEYASRTYKRMQDDIKSGKFKDYADYAADAWLEARYAWRPLIYDANNVIKLLKSEKTLQPRQTFRGFDGDEDSLFVSTSLDDSGYVTQVDLDIVQISGHRAGFLCQTSFEAALNHQLGVFNVATAAWDLVPFSFVVDWFINIGGILRTLNPNPIFKTIGSWVVSTSHFEVNGTVTYTLPDTSTESTTFRATRRIKERIPDVGARYANLDVNLDIPKLVDGLALLLRASLR
nr:MAG: hypothetical protein 1 [Leviviridae sp.]